MSNINEREFRLKLIQLVKRSANSDALSLIENKEINEIWCDKAVAVYVLSDRKEKAQETIEWAKDNADLITWRRCLLEYSENLLKEYFKTSEDKYINLGQATPKEKEILKDIVNTLSPIVDHIKADQQVSNPLELRALLQTANCSYVLGNIKKTEELATLLQTYTPIPLDYVKMVLSRLVQPKEGIVSRIYSEHKDNFEALLLALVVESELFNKSKDAFEKGKQLKTKPRTEAEKKDYCGALFTIAQIEGVEALKECCVIAEKLLGKESTLTIVIDASAHLRQGDIESAKLILESNRKEDDAHWLQVYSYCLFSEDNFKEGLEFFSKATEKIPSIEMYKVMGEAAIKSGYIDKAIIAFETVLKATPEDTKTLVFLAELYLKANDFEGAEKHLKKLWKLEPDNTSYSLNYAKCVATQGKIDEAIKIYDRICSGSNPSVYAFMAIAHLYKSKQEAAKGFRYLDKSKDVFWDNPQFLMTYMDLGYSSENELLAHEAFIRVRELQAEGKASPDIIQEKTIEEFIQYSKGWNEKTNELCKNIVQGKFSWLIADSFLNHAAYTGWGIRTQSLTWLNDDINSRATYCIYSTNSFHAKLENGQRKLKPLIAPAPNSKVVVDLSALITLHRLDLIETAKDYFGKLYVSTRYSSYLLEDSDRLCFHQLSHIKSTRLIKQEIDSANIAVLSDIGKPNQRPYPYIHEHTMPENEEEHYYRLRDVIKVLHDSGEIDKPKYTELQRISTKVCGSDKNHPVLSFGQNVIVELSTLRTLINQGVYDALNKSFQLHIMPETQATINSEMWTIGYQENLQEWNNDLMQVLNSDLIEGIPPNFVDDNEAQIWMDSYHLAKSRNLNLLVDDRTIQAVSLNDANYKKEVFGTDVLLKALEKNSSIDYQQIASSFSKLLKWRYRFLVPSETYLLRLAAKYKTNPPGQDLRNVALYLHDCMRDQGLFSGLEKTEPPMQMSAKFFSAWVETIVNFVVSLWKDDSFELEAVRKFTRWSLRELLPSPPKTLVLGGIRIANIIPKIVLNKAIIGLALWENQDKAKIAMREIKDSLEIPDDLFFKIFTDITNIVGENVSGPDLEKDEVINLRNRFVDICLEGKFDIRTYTSLFKHGLVKESNLIEDSDSVIKILRGKTDSLCSLKGPYISHEINSGKDNAAIRISDLLLNVDVEIREATMEYLLSQDMSNCLCSKTISEITKQKKNIVSKSKNIWIPSAIKASDIITEDWLFNYQGALQTLKMSFKDGFLDYLTKVIRPEISSLENINSGVLSPTYNQEEVQKEIKGFVEKSQNLIDALKLYYNKYGHIPLSENMSICFLYDEWVEKKGNVQNSWQILWGWAASYPSPIPKYHVCYFFVNKTRLIPKDKKGKLTDEILGIIHQPEDNESERKNSWLIRFELARYYCQFLECRLPGAHGEKIATQSWWLADKVASLYGNASEHIKGFSREQTIKPEEDLINHIWRLVHLGVESSSLRYATLYVKSLWSLSLVSQFNKEIFDIMFSVATDEQKKHIEHAVSGNLLNLFPIRQSENKIQVFAYDKGCITAAKELAKAVHGSESKEMIKAFIAGAEKVVSEEGFKEALKRIPEGNEGDNLLTTHAIQIMGHMNIAPKEFIWDCFSDKEWSINIFSKLNFLYVESLFNGLTEIQLRNKDKWDDQFPHFYAMLCEELNEDKERQKLFFAFTVISSLAAGSVSAINRLLKGKNRFDYKDEVDFWHQKIDSVYPQMPEWCRSRIRAISTSLHI